MPDLCPLKPEIARSSFGSRQFFYGFIGHQVVKVIYFIINKVGQKKYNFVLSFDFASKFYILSPSSPSFSLSDPVKQISVTVQVIPVRTTGPALTE